jgi:hypothetical protein
VPLVPAWCLSRGPLRNPREFLRTAVALDPPADIFLSPTPEVFTVGTVTRLSQLVPDAARGIVRDVPIAPQRTGEFYERAAEFPTVTREVLVEVEPSQRAARRAMIRRHRNGLAALRRATEPRLHWVVAERRAREEAARLEAERDRRFGPRIDA